MNFNRRTALSIGALMIAIGSIAPWITVLGLISAGPFNFTEVGLITVGALGLITMSVAFRRWMRPVSIIVGLIMLSQVGYVWFALSEQNTNELVSPGWGLWFTTAASMYLIVSTFVAKHPPMERYRIASVQVAQPGFDENKPFSQGPPTSS